MRIPEPTPGPVDTDRLHFDVVHSLFKQTVARIGRDASGGGLAVEFLLAEDPQTAEVHENVSADLRAKLERLAPLAESLDALFELLLESCSHPSNMYTEVHWLPVRPELPEPGT